MTNLHEHLQPLPTDLLIALAKGEVDIEYLAARMVAERGLNKEGKWVGFARAAEVWGLDRH